MFGFLKSRIVRMADAAVLRDVEKHRYLWQAATAEEASMGLLSTSMAAKFLRAATRTTMPFPALYLHGAMIPDTGDAQGKLSRYIMELIALQKTASTSSSPAIQLTAAGFAILANSVRAVTRPTLLPEGRRLWHELLRGLSHYPESYREFVNATANDSEIEQSIFVPRMLAPEWQNS